MTTALRHRGPDDEGFFVSPFASLGSRRLSIVDVVHGHQPMRNENGSVVVAFNGEIYNAESLRNELVSRGHRFNTRCDTEVIPHLYEEHGDEFVQQLDGQFAIAVWDGSRRRMLLSRDRAGIKPLYYAELGGRFLFGSEIKSILASVRSRPPLSLEAVYHYLSFKYVPPPLTIYEGVAAVQPAEQVVLHDGRVTKRRYWDFGHSPCEIGDEHEIVDQLERLLVRSVRRRLIADTPVGALLSGGLDSSLIVAMAAEAADRPISTFTLAYEEDFANKQREVDAARRVADLFGTEHYEYVTSYRELLEDLPTILGCFDEPFAAVMSPYFLHKLVRKHVKVCLGGDGADELFGSYLPHRLAVPIHHLMTYGEAAVRQRPELVAPFEDDIDRVVSLAQPQDWAWRASLSVFPEDEKRAYLNSDHKVFTEFDSTALVRDIFDAYRSDDVQNRQQNHDFRTVLPNVVLNFNDKLSMAHSVETRVPFLNHELVEFAFSLPGRLKINSGCCKWLLKEVARRRLPADIVDRPKEGFVMPINVWQQTVLREVIEQTLASGRIATHGFFEEKAVGRLVDRYYAGETGLQYQVWALFCFQSWYDGAVREPVVSEAADEVAGHLVQSVGK
jgi:asparagine synthase (glutamine-hydrolysing)